MSEVDTLEEPESVSDADQYAFELAFGMCQNFARMLMKERDIQHDPQIMEFLNKVASGDKKGALQLLDCMSVYLRSMTA